MSLINYIPTELHSLTGCKDEDTTGEISLLDIIPIATWEDFWNTPIKEYGPDCHISFNFQPNSS